MTLGDVVAEAWYLASVSAIAGACGALLARWVLVRLYRLVTRDVGRRVRGRVPTVGERPQVQPHPTPPVPPVPPVPSSASVGPRPVRQQAAQVPPWTAGYRSRGW